jgi:SanA protein
MIRVKYLVSLMLITCLASYVNYKIINKQSAPFIKSNSVQLEPYYTAIIFGAGLWPSGEPSTILKDRLNKGIELYQNKKVKRLLLSGDNGNLAHDEPEAMKKYLLIHGIPKEDIFLDYAGFDTYSTLYRAKEIFKVDSAILVSQTYHLNRALFIAKKLGIQAQGFTSDLRHYRFENKYIIREIPALAKAQLNIIFHRKPKYLGQIINIHGKSNAMLKEAAMASTSEEYVK